MIEYLHIFFDVATLSVVILIAVRVLIENKDQALNSTRLLTMEDEILRLRERMHGLSHDLLDTMTKAEILKSRQYIAAKKLEKDQE